MALKPLLSFSSGELDPVLHDNVTLEKFNKGLETARNVIISKTGSITSRFPRKYLKSAKYPDGKCKVYAIPHTPYFLEVGVDGDDSNGYVRCHNIQLPFSSLETSYTTTWDKIRKIQFITTKSKTPDPSDVIYVYMFVGGESPLLLKISPDVSIGFSVDELFDIREAPTSVTYTGNGTGYNVDYMVTAVVNGQETHSITSVGSNISKPILSTEKVTLTITVPSYFGDEVSEVRVYSRPKDAGAFGYLGSTNEKSGSVFTFVDSGQLPDYTQSGQELVTNLGLNGRGIDDLKPNAAIIYQGRLIVVDNNDREVLVASRPNYYNNFYRDFPYDADSALMFKSGSSGRNNIIRMIESDGLIIFTTTGVFTSVGILSPTNLVLEKRGSWVIKEDIPPLLVPGGIFFVDQNDTIRQLIFSQDIMAYESLEQSIFSNHLFREREIVSWSYQEGNFPVIIVVFSDGTWATFTYNYEHQMKAWTRHDGNLPVEQVEGTMLPDTTIFVVNKNGGRQFEVSLPRYAPNNLFLEDPESVMKEPNVLMDGLTSSSLVYNWSEFTDMFDPEDIYVELSPVIAGEWSGQLNLIAKYPNGDLVGDDFEVFMDSNEAACVGSFSSGCFANLGAVNSKMKWFNPEDQSSVLLTTIEKVNNGHIIVEVDAEFPSKYAVKPKLYAVRQEILFLDHLEGEEVSILADGAVLSSPNDIVDYPKYVVTGGKITLPEGLDAAIVIVGRPVIADVETLNMSTVEQSPVTLESLTVNKLYIKVFKSRGLYVGPIFPETKYEEKDGSSVKGMESLDKRLVPEYNPLLGNVYAKPLTMRIEKNIIGSWKSQGKICIRQVDPLHFEIVSIIPDVEISRRSDR